MTEKLKPCPACGGDAIPCATFAACCNRPDCCLVGPSGDPTGAKWNSLPRRTDASHGMSDGELIARAIREGNFTRLAAEGAWDNDMTEELDRRAAARKESKP